MRPIPVVLLPTRTCSYCGMYPNQFPNIPEVQEW